MKFILFEERSVTFSTASHSRPNTSVNPTQDSKRKEKPRANTRCSWNGGHKRNTKRHSTRTYPSRLDFRSNWIRSKVSPRSDSAKSSSPETTIGACSVETRSRYKYRTTRHSIVRPCSVQHSRIRALGWNKRWNIRRSCWTWGGSTRSRGTHEQDISKVNTNGRRWPTDWPCNSISGQHVLSPFCYGYLITVTTLPLPIALIANILLLTDRDLSSPLVTVILH